jgi:hypothetical protein
MHFISIKEGRRKGKKKERKKKERKKEGKKGICRHQKVKKLLISKLTASRD